MPDFMHRRRFLALPLMAGVVRVGDAMKVVFPGMETKHPDPRPGITAEKILSPEAYEKEVRRLEKSEKRVTEVLKKVSRAYEHAREIPEVLDGLYCYCACDSYGHRSLLSCYEVVQAVGCWSCKDEAELAYKLHKAGNSLDEIRAAVDKRFGDDN
jgi:hypothetical protein